MINKMSYLIFMEKKKCVLFSFLSSGWQSAAKNLPF